MLIENGMLKTNDGDLENVVISDGVSNLEELIYDGSVWLLARRNIKALLSIKTLMVLLSLSKELSATIVQSILKKSHFGLKS
jgi:hypothetical protein